MKKTVLRRTAALACAALITAALAACARSAAKSEPAGVAPPEPAASGPLKLPVSGEADAPAGEPLFTVEEYPRVDGSTANLPLMAEVMSRTCGIPLEEAETLVVASKTAQSWRMLSYGSADLLMVYEIPENVKAELGAAYEAMQITPLGRDGLVFLVNKGNPVPSLSTAQLRDIYTGRVTNWKELGGQDAEIIPFQRDHESGSQTLFLKLLMDGETPTEAPTELAPGAMGGLIDALAQYDASGPAIGYSVYYYASQMYANPDLRLMAVDGVEPTAQSLGDGSYPLVNEFYLVIRKDEEQNSPARRLQEWMLSPQGAAALQAAGYVAVNQ